MSLNPRRAISRARGRALRAAGVPNVPNLPSARSLARRELRRATGGSSRRRGRQPDGDGTSLDDLFDQSPLVDPSRELGEGPDELTTSQAVMVGLGVLLFVWLLIASNDPELPTVPPCDVTSSAHGHC